MTIGVSVGGTASFSIGGVLYELAGTIKVDPGGVIRKPAVGPSGPTGKWTETIDPPMIEVDMFDDPALSIVALRGSVGTDVQLALKNGKTYILHNAFQVDKIDLDAVAGKFNIKFSGTDCEEDLP